MYTRTMAEFAEFTKLGVSPTRLIVAHEGDRKRPQGATHILFLYQQVQAIGAPLGVDSHFYGGIRGGCASSLSPRHGQLSDHLRR